jgi:hypothetical protein
LPEPTRAGYCVACGTPPRAALPSPGAATSASARRSSLGTSPLLLEPYGRRLHARVRGSS